MSIYLGINAGLVKKVHCVMEQKESRLLFFIWTKILLGYCPVSSQNVFHLQMREAILLPYRLIITFLSCNLVTAGRTCGI